MKHLSKTLLGAVVAVALVVGGATAADATVAYPEGGTWDYGVKWGGGGTDFVKSDYHHMTRDHSASACVAQVCDKTGWISPRTWALAKKPAGTWGNSAYYNVR